jgi:hypothetical protein
MMPTPVFSNFVMVNAQFGLGFPKALLYGPTDPAKPNNWEAPALI